MKLSLGTISLVTLLFRDKFDRAVKVMSLDLRTSADFPEDYEKK